MSVGVGTAKTKRGGEAPELEAAAVSKGNRKARFVRVLCVCYNLSFLISKVVGAEEAWEPARRAGMGAPRTRFLGRGLAATSCSLCKLHGPDNVRCHTPAAQAFE